MSLFDRFRRAPKPGSRSAYSPTPPRPEPLAIGIDGAEMQRIIEIFRTANEKMHIARPHLTHNNDHNGLVKELHMRLGAAAAIQDAPRSIPLLDRDFASIEYAITSLRCDGGFHAVGAHRAADEAEAFLNMLRVRLGHAEAVATLGTTHTIHVFRSALEPSTTQR